MPASPTQNAVPGQISSSTLGKRKTGGDVLKISNLVFVCLFVLVRFGFFFVFQLKHHIVFFSHDKICYEKAILTGQWWHKP